MAWHALYKTATGELVSVGNAPVASPLPGGLTKVDLAGPVDLSTQQWDQAAKAFAAMPPRVVTDRIDDLLADSAIAGLNTAQKTNVRNAALRAFGNVEGRFYA